MSSTDDRLPQDGAVFEYGEVRRCECHGMYYRPYMYAPLSGKVHTHAQKNRDGWSGDDLVNAITFTLDEWRALPRV